MSPTRYASEPVDPAPLGQPLHFEFSGKIAKSRFLKAAMTEQLATWDANKHEKRGIPTPELINIYRRWGEGGFGLILTGNTMIEFDQLEAAGNAIIPRSATFSGERFEAFKELASVTKKQGSLAVCQLSHPGRQVSERINAHPISSSDVQLEGVVMGATFAKPRPMAKEDFNTVIDKFAHAAEFCYEAGFDGIQLHAAHGYLLAQFLAPSTNLRTDQYGGSLENRSRIIFEIVDAIRQRVADPAFMLGIKVNSVEFQDGGFSSEDCKVLVGLLEQRGFDFVELSGGTYQELGFHHKRESTKKREGFFLEFADSIIPALDKTRAYVTGGLRTAGAMVKALDTAQGIGLARPVCDDFDLPNLILQRKVDAAVETKLDPQNFGLTNIAAGTQMRLVGNNHEPLDLSHQEHVDAFSASMQQWTEAMGRNDDGSKFGYVDVSGVELRPYGSSYTFA